MMKHALFCLIVALAAHPVPAFAHAFLLSANPPVGGTVRGPPGELQLNFSEPVELVVSGIEVTSAAGRAVITGTLHSDAHDSKRVLIGLPPLPPGLYRVHWHVVSIDTHMTEGDFTFTVH